MGEMVFDSEDAEGKLLEEGEEAEERKRKQPELRGGPNWKLLDEEYCFRQDGVHHLGTWFFITTNQEVKCIGKSLTLHESRFWSWKLGKYLWFGIGWREICKKWIGEFAHEAAKSPALLAFTCIHMVIDSLKGQKRPELGIDKGNVPYPHILACDMKDIEGPEDKLFMDLLENDLRSYLLTQHTAKQLVELLDVCGETLPHWTVIHNLPQILEQLLDAGVDPNMKNSKGQSLLDLASERGIESCVKVIEKKFPTLELPKTKGISTLDIILETSKDPFNLPGMDIYIPTAATEKNTKDLLQQTRMKQLLPSLHEVNEGVALHPSVSEAHNVPVAGNPDDGWARGGKAERDVFNEVIKTLKEIHLQEAFREWRFYLFTNLKLFSGEYQSELDACILGYHLKEKHSVGFLLEVKSTLKVVDIFKLSKKKCVTKKAARQLETLRRVLKDIVGEDISSWMKICLAYPNFKEASSKISWEENLRITADHDLPPNDLILLFGEKFGNAGTLKDFFTAHLLNTKVKQPAFGDVLLLMTVLSHGHIIKEIHQQSDRLLVTILEKDQEHLLQHVIQEKSKIVCIVGPSGSGKSFLALVMIQKLIQNSKISKTSQAWIIIPEKCTAFSAWLSDQLQKLEIDQCVNVRIFPSFISAHEAVHKTNQQEGPKYIFFDQLEDFKRSSSFKWDNGRIKRLVDEKSLSLLVTLMNNELQDGAEYLVVASTHFLGHRLRSPLATANFLDQSWDSSWNTISEISKAFRAMNLPSSIPPPEMGLTLNPHSSGILYTVIDTEEQLPNVILKLCENENMKTELMTVVHSDQDFPKKFQKALAKSRFGTIMRDDVQISLAPIIVQAPLIVGNDTGKKVNVPRWLADEVENWIWNMENSSFGDLATLLDNFILWLEKQRTLPEHYCSQDWQKSLALLMFLAEKALEHVKPFHAGMTVNTVNLSPLKKWTDIITHNEFISCLNEENIGGYEAPVIIGVLKTPKKGEGPPAWTTTRSIIAMLSRQTQLGVMVFPIKVFGDATKDVKAELGSQFLTIIESAGGIYFNVNP